MAGYVIQQCPGGGDETEELFTGIGGFLTSGFDEIFDWLEHSPEAVFNPALMNGASIGSPRSTTQFVTVTVSRAPKKSNRPGDTDVGVADRLLGLVRALWIDAPDSLRRRYFYRAMLRFRDKVEEMSPQREDVVWWEYVGGRQAMQYECDKKNEGPAVVDCAKLQYHGLGNGEVEFKQGETKYFNE
ncbi:MAG: hypothetical protein Q9211_006745, partial [Gyalolechia sp. 1 TL-2023]